MSQDGNVIQDRLTKREDSTVQEGITRMDLFTLENSRMEFTLKEGGLSCNKMGLTQILKLKLAIKEKKSANNTRWFEGKTAII